MEPLTEFLTNIYVFDVLASTYCLYLYLYFYLYILYLLLPIVSTSMYISTSTYFSTSTYISTSTYCIYFYLLSLPLPLVSTSIYCLHFYLLFIPLPISSTSTYCCSNKKFQKIKHDRKVQVTIKVLFSPIRRITKTTLFIPSFFHLPLLNSFKLRFKKVRQRNCLLNTCKQTVEANALLIACP